jgi:hypothetical protein
MARFDFKQQIDFLKSLDFKVFNWRALNKLASPQSAADLNAFLEKLPQHAGQTVLIIAGIAWAAAGAAGIYTTLQLQNLTELRSKLQEAEAVKPVVPIIKDAPLDPKEVKAFVDKMVGLYDQISIRANGSSIIVTGATTGAFSQFREAIGHIQNGGSGWRVTMDRLCVGRECDKQPLAASLKINKVSVEKPQ